jgi:hypothetical protein
MQTPSRPETGRYPAGVTRSEAVDTSGDVDMDQLIEKLDQVRRD